MGGMCCGVCAGRRGAAVGEWVVVVVVSRVRRWVVELCCAVLCFGRLRCRGRDARRQVWRVET